MASASSTLDHQSLDLVLDGLDLVVEVGSSVGGDRASDNGTAHTARTSKSLYFSIC